MFSELNPNRLRKSVTDTVDCLRNKHDSGVPDHIQQPHFERDINNKTENIFCDLKSKGVRPILVPVLGQENVVGRREYLSRLPPEYLISKEVGLAFIR